MCAFVVFTFCFSIPSQEIGLENVSEMTYLVSSGTLNHNSINQACGMHLINLVFHIGLII